MIRRIFRWAFYLFITCVVLLVAGILLLDTIAKEIIQSKIRSATGMDAKIGRLSIGLLSPTVTIEDFKLYNTAEFGGSPCVDMPELHVEYDRSAVWSRKIHFKLVRLNLSEVVLVNGKAGKSNFKEMQKNGGSTNGQTSNGGKWDFTGIDILNLTLKKIRTSAFEAPAKDEEFNFGIQNKIFRNLKTQEDFQAVAFLVSANGGLEIPFGKTKSPLQAFLNGLRGK